MLCTHEGWRKKTWKGICSIACAGVELGRFFIKFCSFFSIPEDAVPFHLSPLQLLSIPKQALHHLLNLNSDSSIKTSHTLHWNFFWILKKCATIEKVIRKVRDWDNEFREINLLVSNLQSGCFEGCEGNRSLVPPDVARIWPQKGENTFYHIRFSSPKNNWVI